MRINLTYFTLLSGLFLSWTSFAESCSANVELSNRASEHPSLALKNLAYNYHRSLRANCSINQVEGINLYTLSLTYDSNIKQLLKNHANLDGFIETSFGNAESNYSFAYGRGIDELLSSSDYRVVIRYGLESSINISSLTDSEKGRLKSKAFAAKVFLKTPVFMPQPSMSVQVDIIPKRQEGNKTFIEASL